MRQMLATNILGIMDVGILAENIPNNSILSPVASLYFGHLLRAYISSSQGGLFFNEDGTYGDVTLTQSITYVLYVDGVMIGVYSYGADFDGLPAVVIKTQTTYTIQGTVDTANTIVYGIASLSGLGLPTTAQVLLGKDKLNNTAVAADTYDTGTGVSFTLNLDVASTNDPVHDLFVATAGLDQPYAIFNSLLQPPPGKQYILVTNPAPDPNIKSLLSVSSVPVKAGFVIKVDTITNPGGMVIDVEGDGTYTIT